MPRLLIVSHYVGGGHSNYMGDYGRVRDAVRACQHELDTLPHVVRHEIFHVAHDGVLTLLKDMSGGLGKFV